MGSTNETRDREGEDEVPPPPEGLGPLNKWRYCKLCEEYKVFVHGGLAPTTGETFWECRECGYIPNGRM